MDEVNFNERLSRLDQLQSACTHCGICSEGCATYLLTGWEHDSPRGRIQIAAQFLDGQISPESEVLSTFDRCLGCRACENLCPQEVSYHSVRRLVQELRQDLHISPSSIMSKSEYQRWITLAQRIGSKWWRHYGSRWLNIPPEVKLIGGSFTKKNSQPSDQKTVLAVCCVQDLFQHDVIEQTLSFVKRLGYALEIDRNQPCCGAIFERLVVGGEETIRYSQLQKKVAARQEKTRHAFLKWLPADTVFLSQGCQAFIAPHQQAVDLYAWIEKLLDERGLCLQLPEEKEVYYQAYCKKFRGTEDSILRLLQSIRGLTVRQFSFPLACCGGFCGETLLHPKQAEGIAMQKISELPPKATVVVTSPDCFGLFKTFANEKEATICYPIQLLNACLVSDRIKPDPNVCLTS